jgi:hypothetical protein
MSFIRLQVTDQIVDNETVVRPAWSNNVQTLTTFYTPSVNDSSYYLNVYSVPPAINPSSTEEFNISYGHISGSGSVITTQDNVGSTQAIYGQFRNIVYNSELSNFNFGGVISSDIYVISVKRNRFRESIKEGSFNLSLKSGSYTLNLTDNSNESSVTSYLGNNKYFTIVSGSNGSIASGSTTSGTASGSYGFVFPDKGLIILNARALSLPTGSKGINLQTLSGSTTNVTNNCTKLYQYIQAGGNFKLSSKETISSQYITARVPYRELNHTTNPSVIDNNGNVLYTTLIDNPEVFVTTVGLYNDTNDLLAVAKLSKPIKKSFVKDLQLKIKLSF